MSTATLHNEKKKTLVPQLRFQEFDEDWKEKKFSALLKEGRLGGNYENSESNNGIPVIKMGNLGRGEININKIQCLPENIEYNKEDILIKGDLLFNTRNTLELVGKVSIWRNELPFALYNSNLMRMKFHNEIESSNVFMNYNFNTKNSINQLRRFATGTTSVAAIYGKDLKSFNITFPTLPEQQKIASFLSAVDEKIQQLSRKKELLEQYKKGVMQQLFSGKLRFKDENGKDYADWEEKRLGDVAKRVTRKNKENNLNVLTISAQLGLVSQLEYFNKSVSAKDVTNYYLLERNDFAYNKSYSNGYPMGAIKRLKKYDKGVVSTLYICFCFNERVSLNFMEQYFEFGLHNYEIEKVAQEGARNHGLLNIGVNDFLNIALIIPSIQEQQKIANFLSSIDTKIESTTQQINQTQSFKKGLLQQLFV
jgi:type I restriction enzyme S subunit